MATAHGRARGLNAYNATGAVLLAGEITARTIHRQLAAALTAGPIRALTCIIEDLWPMPGPAPEPPHGHPGMNLGRMRNDLPPALLAPWQRQALKPLTYAYTHSHATTRANVGLLRGIARSVYYAHTRLRDHAEEFTSVRQDILTRRGGRV